MTQEEKKELVIKDLCGRLPYGVIVQVNDGLKGAYDSQLVQVFCDRVSCSVNVRNPLKECICIDSVKPYLRSMSSMTEEEKKVYGGIVCDVTYGEFHKTTAILTDWLNKKMFDHRGLIPEGLAHEAPEGMYENESDLVIDCSNGCVLSLKQIKEHYDLYIEKNTGTIIIN